MPTKKASTESVDDVEATFKVGGNQCSIGWTRREPTGDESNRDEKKADKDDGISNQKLKELGRPRGVSIPQEREPTNSTTKGQQHKGG